MTFIPIAEKIKRFLNWLTEKDDSKTVDFDEVKNMENLKVASKAYNYYPKSLWVKTSNAKKDGYLTLSVELDGQDDDEDMLIMGLSRDEGIHLQSRNLSWIFKGRDEEIAKLERKLESQAKIIEIYKELTEELFESADLYEISGMMDSIKYAKQKIEELLNERKSADV